MSDKKDIRWQQRFNHYKKALSQLNKFVVKKELNELEQQGLIKSFEYTFELSWNVMKDFLEYSGNTKMIAGSRDAISETFRLGIINDGEGWMSMIKDRNQTSHSYNEDTANEISRNILTSYFDLFMELKNSFEQLIKEY